MCDKPDEILGMNIFRCRFPLQLNDFQIQAFNLLLNSIDIVSKAPLKTIFCLNMWMVFKENYKVTSPMNTTV